MKTHYVQIGIHIVTKTVCTCTCRC